MCNHVAPMQFPRYFKEFKPHKLDFTLAPHQDHLMKGSLPLDLCLREHALIA